MGHMFHQNEKLQGIHNNEKIVKITRKEINPF